MTRIVSGAARGRRLAVPGAGTRPTADRAREALFSSLEAILGSLAGARVLDLYAGSGAVGLEALSRGAARVVLVESDRAAARVLADNVGVVGLPGAVVVHRSVEAYLSGPAEAFDLVFADPPYAVADTDLSAVIAAATDRGWLAADGLVVVERPSRGPRWQWPEGVQPLRERRYGEATLWYGRAAPGQ